MKKANKPENEEERLKVLESYQLLNSAREELFDNITWLASKICHTPISLINLITQEYQWSKSSIGLSIELTPRDIAFCSHTILSNEILEIPDATKDPRFVDNPTVIGDPYIRFYAGAPLITHQGYKLGALCVIDHEPRELKPFQREVLTKLSKMVITLFETKKAIISDMCQIKHVEQSLTESNQKLHKTLKSQQKYNENMKLLEEMNALLQACENFEESFKVIGKYCLKIFPNVKGAIYFIDHTHQFVDITSSFGFENTEEINKTFLAHDCWGLRLGLPHEYCAKEDNLICNHVEANNVKKHINSYCCLPLSSQGDIFGLLHLEFSSSCDHENRSKMFFTKSFAEQIALSIANLKLRKTLQTQSTTDPLTGLYNRRYYHNNINWLIHKNEFNNKIMAFVMIDIDYFKRFNDTYGHDAGDMVLVCIANLIKKHSQEQDLVYRLGGEEFLMILEDTTKDNVKNRLESIRQEAEKSNIFYKDQKLNPPTISVGVMFLDSMSDNLSSDDILLKADKALYKSKENGRNQISYHD